MKAVSKRLRSRRIVIFRFDANIYSAKRRIIRLPSAQGRKKGSAEWTTQAGPWQTELFRSRAAEYSGPKVCSPYFNEYREQCGDNCSLDSRLETIASPCEHYRTVWMAADSYRVEVHITKWILARIMSELSRIYRSPPWNNLENLLYPRGFPQISMQYGTSCSPFIPSFDATRRRYCFLSALLLLTRWLSEQIMRDLRLSDTWTSRSASNPPLLFELVPGHLTFF